MIRTESFCASFHRTLFHTGILDERKCGRLFRDVDKGIRRYHGATDLWHKYLVFRCRQQPEAQSGESQAILDWGFSGIRRAADALIQECGGDRDEVIDKLCWLNLDCARSGEEVFDERTICDSRERKPELSILSAAVYFGYASLAQRLLDEGHDPTTNAALFPSPMYTAARTGQVDMLLLLQEHLPQFPHDTPQWPHINWHSKIGPGSLKGASARGDLEIVKLCLYPPSRVLPDDETLSLEEKQALILGHKPGSIPEDSILGRYILESMAVARSPEVYQYLNSLVGFPRGTGYYARDDAHSTTNLAEMALANNLPMMRYQLENGADPSGIANFGTPLVYAVRALHHDAVDLLLRHGADPNFRGAYRRGTVLTAAARTGSLVMMRKLLDAGAKFEDPGNSFGKERYTLIAAVRSENREMVDLLLDMGLGRDGARAGALRIADGLGSESIVEGDGIDRGEGGRMGSPSAARSDAGDPANCQYFSPKRHGQAFGRAYLKMTDAVNGRLITRLALEKHALKLFLGFSQGDDPL